MGGKRCAVEICADAQQGILNNERFPKRDVDVIVWITRSFNLKDNGGNDDQRVDGMFPLAPPSGILVQCGSGNIGQDAYPIGSMPFGAFFNGSDQGDPRLGVYKFARNNYVPIRPSGWRKLTTPNTNDRLTHKVVYWLNL